jgi:hypothetical protein
MSPKTALAVLAALVAAALAASAARATQVYYVPLEAMAKESDVIVHARVIEQQVVWDHAIGRILTLTSLDVLDPLKGAKRGEKLTIYQVGGTLDGVTTYVPGALKFAAGEEMVFFAMRMKDSTIVSYGMGLGKYGVYTKEGVTYAGPAYGDVAWVQRGTKGWEPAAAPAYTEEPLDKFKARVRAALGAVR